jgi:hypothetical protein
VLLPELPHARSGLMAASWHPRVLAGATPWADPAIGRAIQRQFAAKAAARAERE